MKRLVRYGLVGIGLLATVIVIFLLLFRHDLAEMALRSALEFAEEKVVENLPPGETVDGVRKEFDALLARLEEGRVNSDDLKPLLDKFADAYKNQSISSDEVKQILEEVRRILRR
jgi:hypothetical protein